MSEKARLDARMVILALTTSREKAHALIVAGCVYVNGQICRKASQSVTDADAIEVKQRHPFVSRGGLKLDKAMTVFPIDVRGKTCIDVGASTGGFTDCLLQNGAATVYAIDVGYGQLDWSLRNDPRVIVKERVNARYMHPDWFLNENENKIESEIENKKKKGLPDFACMDVSFISIRLILKPLWDCLADDAAVVALIKPQFEAGRGKVGKKGVVRDNAVHIEVITDMLAFARATGYAVKGLDFSPITGPQGNVEFLLYLTKEEKEEKEEKNEKSGKSAWNEAQNAAIAAQTVKDAAAFHQQQ